MRATSFLAALIAGGAALAQPATTMFEPIPDAIAVDSHTQADEVQLGEDGSDRMTVPVRVSGSGPYRFLVDTGADRTAVSRQLAARLRLPPGGAVRMHTPTGPLVVATANVPSLQLGVRELDIRAAPLLEATYIGADGILGTDSLRSQRVVFDFKSGFMTIVPSAEAIDPADRDAIVVRGKLRRGRLIVSQAEVEGKRATIVVDTGSEVSIGNLALRRRLLGDRPVARDAMVEVQSVTGAILHAELVIVKNLSLGGVVVENLPVVFADAHTFARLGFDRRPALLLGMDAMRAFERVSIDFANKKLRLLMPQESGLQVLLATR